MITTGKHTLPAEEALALAFAFAIAIYLFVRWLRSGERKPDPWETVEAASPLAGEPEAPICLHCLTPHSSTAHFCPQCDCAVGDYNNYMPFEYLFSEGEVLRSGTSGAVRMTPLTTTGYILLSFATFSLLAPIYWLAMFLRTGRGAKGDATVAAETTENP